VKVQKYAQDTKGKEEQRELLSLKVIEWKELCFRLVRLGMRHRNIILLLASQDGG
jgi:hypothetical protein